jgi:Bromodomain/PHD-finger
MKCRRRIDSVAIEFKKRCIAQGSVRLEDAEFENILLYTCGRGVNPKKGGNARVNKVNGLRPAQEIRKIPLNDFPREISASVDLEPGELDDYRSVFTSEGTFLRKEPLFPLVESETVDGGGREEEIQEDGSVDYCLVCRKPGDLLCCDRCPRAYHTACVGNGIDPPDGRWECHVCIKEKAGLDQDLVDGRSYLHKNGISSIEKITASLVKLPNCDGFVESHQILSMIHEMLSKLMDYEFGYIFRAPVDCTFVPSYKKIVKKPMDLGTISLRLENGHYAKRFLSISNSWDDVLAAVLEDIELVWHNCFTFNLEGSAVYKMAEVHRRRYLEMRRRSFDHLLSDDVKSRVAGFVERCEQERIPAIQSPKEKSAARFSVPSKYRMDVKVAYGGNRRDVAILDPETGMLAKMYASQKSACHAANFLRALGHKCELEALSDHVVKNFIKNSAYDPSQLLFGYRWLLVEDLRGGKVIFGKGSKDRKGVLLDGTVHKKESPPGFVEMRDGDSFYMFLSIEEALCFDGLPKEVPLHQVRSKFCELPYGEWTAVVGFNWRRVASEVPAATEEGTEKPSAEGQLIVKKDSITGRRLLGFDTVAAAYKDWLATCSNSPMFSQEKNTSIEEFSSKYLDKDGQVDGIVWKSMNSVQFVSPPEGTNQAGTVEHNGIQKTAIAGLDEGDENINTSKSPSTELNGKQHLHPGTDALMKAVATTTMPQERSDLAIQSTGKNGPELIHGSLPILEPTTAVTNLGPTSEARASTENGLKRSVEIDTYTDSSPPAFKKVAVDAMERTTTTTMMMESE